MKTISLLIVLSIIIITSCYYDSEEALFPDTKCDTSNITYSGKIKSLMDSYCISCHASQVPILTTYDAVSSNSDRIYGDMAHLPGYDWMPKNSSTTIDTCLIKQFDIWRKNSKPQ